MDENKKELVVVMSTRNAEAFQRELHAFAQRECFSLKTYLRSDDEYSHMQVKIDAQEEEKVWAFLQEHCASHSLSLKGLMGVC